MGTPLLAAKLRASAGAGVAASGRERMLATLLANIDGMVYRRRADARWSFELVNEGCLALTGYRPQDFTVSGRLTHGEMMHPDDRAPARTAVEAALQRHERYELEYRIQRADGALRWVWDRGAGVFDADGRLEAIEGVIQDITRRKEAEQALRDAEARYRGIFENAIEGIFQTSADGRYLAVNPALARIYGYESPEQMMMELRDIQVQLYVQPGRREEFKAAMERDGVVTNFESEVYRCDGSVIWISENARAVRDGSGALRYYEGTVEAITDRKLRDSTIRHQAMHDALTGLPNRLLLKERLEQAMAALDGQGGLVALAFVDLDQFKMVNDSLGHEAGDQLLKIMARRLQSCVREHDVVARQGGDEFVLLLTGNLSRMDVRALCERILATVGQPCVVAGREFSMGCSIGIALCPVDGHDIKGLLRCADAAMYRAKELGRNNLQFFSAEMNAHAAGRLEAVMRLHHAVERGEFELHYEPKCELGGRIVGVEALIRWRTPNGLVHPAAFIPLAEETGAIVPIGEWVLRTACAQNAAWQKQGLPRLPVAVNLSRRQLARDDFAAQVQAVLASTGLPPSDLELEITESAVMQDKDRAGATLARLRALGVRISMDDFGTGYSSLGDLRRFKVQSLKIDRSFLRDVASDPDSAAIVRAVVSLAHSLELRVLAEGVESQAQLDFLRAIGCDEFQGYFKARAMPAAAFAELLAASA